MRIFSQSISQRTWNMVAILQMCLWWSFNHPVTYLGEIRDYHKKNKNANIDVVVLLLFIRLRFEDFDRNRFVLSHLLDTKLSFMHISWWTGLITWQGHPMALASCVHSTVCAMFGYIIAFYSCLKINRKQNWKCSLRNLALITAVHLRDLIRVRSGQSQILRRLSLNQQAG